MNLAAHPRRSIVAAFFLFAVFAPLEAAPARFQNADLAELRAARIGERIHLDDVMLPSGSAALDLEEFDVYAPGAAIEAIGEGGVAVSLKRPAVRYFRGRVDGDASSMVFLAMGKETGGFIVAHDRKYRVMSRSRTKPGAVRDDGSDIVIEEVSLTEEMPYDGEVWACEVDDFPLGMTPSAASQISAAMEHVEANSLGSSTATYVLNIAVEGDFELFTRQGSSSTATATYLANLVAATSVIYQRDLRTELRIAYSGHHTVASDPFTMDPSSPGSTQTTFDALVEFGKRWHNSPPSSALRSAAMLVSGKDYGAGVAWTDWICQGDFPHSSTNVPGGYGGAYGVFMDAGLATNFNPDANTNYRADTDPFGFEYWPMLAFAHEFGHTVQSDHTHCVALTPEEKTTFGVTRNYVDECYSGENGCYSNGTAGAVNANLPPELGTVMSYCHLTTGNPVGFGAATRYTFGQAGEPSIKIVNNMVGAINAKTPSLASAISAPASVTSGVASTASIALPASVTFTWSITNGVINSGGSGSSGAGGTFTVNFTASASPVTLRITANNANGCGASDVKSIPVVASCALPVITTQPASSSVVSGLTRTLTVVATGATSYQWFEGGSPSTGTLIPGATSSSYTTPALTATRTYSVRVTNACGSVSSNTVTVTVLPAGSSARGDFNGDGKPDLLWRNYSTGAVNIWFLNGTTYLGGATLFTVADPNWRIEGTGDFNGDARTDLIWRNYSTGAVNVWFMNGTTYLGGATLFSVADSNWKIEAVGDFNGDAKDDLIWRNYATGAVNAWFLNGSTYVSGASLFSVADPNWKIEAAGDFNGDAKTDLIWRNYTTGAVNIWYLNGTVYVSGATLFSVADANWRIEATADYNADGKLDLMWRNYASGAVNVWFLNGATYLSGASLFTVASPSWEIAGPR